MKETRMYDMSLEDNNEEMILEGYALKFETPTTNLFGEFHGYNEIIDRHALDNADMSDVCMKYNHSDTNYILARTRNSSLQLMVDDIGLKFRAKLIDTTTNIDAYKMIKSELIDKCSFCFSISEEEWDYETNTRKVLKIDKMFDIAVVDVPAYDKTEVYARSLEDYTNDKEKYIAGKKLDLAKRKLKLKLMLK